MAERGDALNTLYVALTRAVSQMYLICTLEEETTPVDKSYATLLNHFVRSQNQTPEIEHPFRWVTAEREEIEEEEETPVKTLKPDFKVQPNWQKRLWVQMHAKQDDSAIAARKEGLLVHDLMAEVSSTLRCIWTEIISFMPREAVEGYA